MPENQSDLFTTLQNMLNSEQFPDQLKEVLGQMKQESTNSTNGNSEQTSSAPEFDLNLFIKLKSVLEGMNSSSNDPRSNLLLSLKPYLNPSRKEKVDQYIGLFRMEKIFEVMNLSGGEKKVE